jgi:nucleotide-binding universal stress UspA family protein
MAFGGAPFNISADQIKELQVIATQQLEESLKQANVSGDALVTTGPAGTALIDAASERKADLIVVGTIGRTRIQ